MHLPSPVVRVVATMVAATQITGCGSAWHRPAGVTPADAVATWHPDVVRVLVGSPDAPPRIVEVHQPSVQDGWLRGRVFVDRRRGDFAVLRSDIATYRPRGAGAVITLPDSSTIEIDELWERGDSVGGPGVLRHRWEPYAVPLGDVRWIALRSVPATESPDGASANRHASTPALAPGQTVRVWLADSEDPIERAVFLGLTGDSLSVSQDREERRIALASVTRIDLWTGRGGHAGWGLLIGLTVGGAAAAIIVATADVEDCDPSEPGYYPGCGDYTIPPQVVFAPMAVAVGGLIGVLVGAASRTDRWQTVTLDRAFPNRMR